MKQRPTRAPRIVRVEPDAPDYLGADSPPIVGDLRSERPPTAEEARTTALREALHAAVRATYPHLERIPPAWLRCVNAVSVVLGGMPEWWSPAFDRSSPFSESLLLQWIREEYAVSLHVPLGEEARWSLAVAPRRWSIGARTQTHRLPDGIPTAVALAQIQRLLRGLEVASPPASSATV